MRVSPTYGSVQGRPVTDVPTAIHWLIEKRLHWRGDVTLREDHSSVRSGTLPRAMAVLRNTMLAIVSDAAEPLPEIREIFAENRLKAIAAAQQGVL